MTKPNSEKNGIIKLTICQDNKKYTKHAFQSRALSKHNKRQM